MSASVNFPFDTEAQVCSSIYFAFIVDHPYWSVTDDSCEFIHTNERGFIIFAIQKLQSLTGDIYAPASNPLWGLLRETPNTDIGEE